MKLRNFSLSLVLVLVISFLTVPSTFIIGAKNDGNLSDSSYIRYYNATSPISCFNETQDPRYSLVSRPLQMIQYPHKGYPSISSYTSNFDIIVSATETTSDWELNLISDENLVNLSIINSEFDGTYWHHEVHPEQQISGLFDLNLSCSEGQDYQTHSVKLVKELAYPFTFVHISDSHFPGYSPNVNSTAINLQTIQNIKQSNPDFVIHTGDIIDGPSTIFLNPETGKPVSAETQLKLSLWALDKLSAPVFMVAGNHDWDSSSLLPDNPKTVWAQYMGAQKTYNFSVLDWNFVGYSASFEGLTDETYSELSNLANEVNNTSNVLYYHYDFRSKSSQIMESYHVKLALWGHAHKEQLFMSAGTLHHCQAPMFYGSDSFTSFKMEDATTFRVADQLYDVSDFEWTVDTTLPEPTASSPFGLFHLFYSLFILIISKIRRQKRNTQK